jgi:hypothetical protein
MGSNKKMLLVYRGMKSVSLGEEKMNVMLTPQFYTLKREELPIKYSYQAKKIASSLFEGLLDEEGKYEYFVYEDDGQWVFIAYDPEKIRKFLESKGIFQNNLSKLFFAQQVEHVFEKPVMLTDKEVLMSIDGNVVLLPKTILAEENTINTFDSSIVPRKGVVLPYENSGFVSKKEAIVLTSIFIIFAGVFFLEGWYYSRSFEVQRKEMHELLDAYPALQSKMQRENIALKYRMIDTQERKKRETIKTLASMIFKGVTLTSFHINEKSFKAIFSCANANTAQKVEEMAKKSNFTISRDKKSNIVTIEGKV